MQATLPKFVRMVSVDDIGQGSEALRILGVKWLPNGASAPAKEEDQVFKSGTDSNKADSNSPEPEIVLVDSKDEKRANAIDEGVSDEDGDFLNLEIAFAYRARAEAKGARKRAKNMHMYLGFFFPSGIKLRTFLPCPI